MKEIISEARQFCANCENPLVDIFEITQPQGVHDARNIAFVMKMSADTGLSEVEQESLLLRHLNYMVIKGKGDSIEFCRETLELRLPQDFNL